jgi:hypothetical protein
MFLQSLSPKLHAYYFIQLADHQFGSIICKCLSLTKDAVFLPWNYKGEHLIKVLSKVTEPLMGVHRVSFLRRTAFGANQWAFSAWFNSRDLATMLMMSWILAICSGKKIIVYLNDINGAFDKVLELYLFAKL